MLLVARVVEYNVCCFSLLFILHKYPVDGGELFRADARKFFRLSAEEMGGVCTTWHDISVFRSFHSFTSTEEVVRIDRIYRTKEELDEQKTAAKNSYGYPRVVASVERVDVLRRLEERG